MQDVRLQVDMSPPQMVLGKARYFADVEVCQERSLSVDTAKGCALIKLCMTPIHIAHSCNTRWAHLAIDGFLASPDVVCIDNGSLYGQRMIMWNPPRTES